MSPPHHAAADVATLERPRTLANVLLDLREARGDWDQALKDAESAASENRTTAEEVASDRMSEADQRTDALRNEFKARFRSATGLSWSMVEAAMNDGLL